MLEELVHSATHALRASLRPPIPLEGGFERAPEHNARALCELGLRQAFSCRPHNPRSCSSARAACSRTLQRLVQREVTAPGLGLAAAGGAIGIGAGVVQMGAGTLQGLGGGGYQNLWAGGVSLLGGAGLKWFVGPDRAWRTGSAMQRAKYDDLPSQATVVGGVYDALTNFADSLNPHPVFCSGLKQGQ